MGCPCLPVLATALFGTVFAELWLPSGKGLRRTVGVVAIDLCTRGCKCAKAQNLRSSGMFGVACQLGQGGAYAGRSVELARNTLLRATQSGAIKVLSSFAKRW